MSLKNDTADALVASIKRLAEKNSVSAADLRDLAEAYSLVNGVRREKEDGTSRGAVLA